MYFHNIFDFSIGLTLSGTSFLIILKPALAGDAFALFGLRSRTHTLLFDVEFCARLVLPRSS